MTDMDVLNPGTITPFQMRFLLYHGSFLVLISLEACILRVPGCGTAGHAQKSEEKETIGSFLVLVFQ